MEAVANEIKREIIPLELIRASPFQPRGEFEEGELDDLAASLKEVGLIHPIVVRQIKNNGKLLYYELISGERRWRAAKLAGFKTIDASILEISDESASKIALIENVQRVDLNPLEVAFALRKLIDIFRMSQEDVAVRVGKKRSTVANYLRLLALPGSIQDGIRKGSISMGHAKAILSLDSVEMKNKLYHHITEKQMTVREAERESQKLVREKTLTTELVEINQLQRALEARFGTRVELSIGKDKQKGKFVVHFYSLDDLERITELAGVDLAGI